MRRFLRDLRNYLVHYGAAPIVQVMNLGPINEVGMTGHSVKLHATPLLDWSKWKTQSRTYLKAFSDRDGPVLGGVVVAYANAMGALYTWLLQQRAVVMNTANSPERFRIDDRSAAVPAEQDGSDG